MTPKMYFKAKITSRTRFKSYFICFGYKNSNSRISMSKAIDGLLLLKRYIPAVVVAAAALVVAAVEAVFVVVVAVVEPVLVIEA